MLQMEALAWTHQGIVEVAAKEVKKYASDVRAIEPFIFFRTKGSQELARICYMCRSLRGVMQLLCSCSLAQLEGKLRGADFSIAKGHTFAVRARGFQERIDSEALETLVGSTISKQTESVVDLDNPDVTFIVLVDQQNCYLGIDYAGIDLGKRDYKVFSSRASLKGSLAYGMLSIAGFRHGQTLVDPCARDGVIGIEAALFSRGKSPHFYQKDRLAFARLPLGFSTEKAFADWDKTLPKKSQIFMLDSLFHNVQAVKRNSRIAGVDKDVEVSRLEIDWMDTKFDKETVDLVASYPVQLTEHSDAKMVTKFYNELFHQAQYVLKPKGRMIVAMRAMKPVDSAPMKLARLLKVYQGKEILSLALFQKL
jgi:23S rRNA G2445 N2-methylase RlmL